MKYVSSTCKILLLGLIFLTFFQTKIAFKKEIKGCLDNVIRNCDAFTFGCLDIYILKMQRAHFYLN